MHNPDMPTQGQRLATCPNCGQDTCQMTEAEQKGNDNFLVGFVCGNCESYREELLSWDECDAWEEWNTEKGFELHVSWLNLQRENMSEYVDRFVAALNADGIMPMDF